MPAGDYPLYDVNDLTGMPNHGPLCVNPAVNAAAGGGYDPGNYQTVHIGGDSGYANAQNCHIWPTWPAVSYQWPPIYPTVYVTAPASPPDPNVERLCAQVERLCGTVERLVGVIEKLTAKEG
jgi:hypothetical protein